MTSRLDAFRGVLLACLLAPGAVACSSDGGDGHEKGGSGGSDAGAVSAGGKTAQDAGTEAGPTSSTEIGRSGGTVSSAGVEVVVPAGALAAPAMITVTVVTSGYPALSEGRVFRSKVYALEPHGQSFTKPVTVKIPFTGASGPSPSLALVTAAPDGEWSDVAGASYASELAQADVTHFSFFAVTDSSSVDGGAADAAPGAGGTGAGGSTSTDSTEYELIELGALGDDKYVEAHAISEDGRVTVWSKPSNGIAQGTAGLWEEGTLTSVGTLAGEPIINPMGVNSTGVVVGNSGVAVGSRAFMTVDGMATAIFPNAPTGVEGISTAVAINDMGQILGTRAQMQISAGVFSSGTFLWKDGVATDVTFPDVTVRSTAGKPVALNAHGSIAFESGIYKDGAFTQCEGVAFGVKGMNDLDELVGMTATNDSTGLHTRNFLCKGGAVSDIPIPAVDINNKGEMISPSDVGQTGLLYKNGNVIELTSKIPTGSDFSVLHKPFAINDDGWIVGVGKKKSNPDPYAGYAFLLRPKR